MITTIITTIESANKIKEQLKYIETKKERDKVPEINADPMRRGIVNEQLWWRQRHK